MCLRTSNCMFLGQFGINSPKLVFRNRMKLPERSEGNFFMFLKTNEDYLSQIAPKNMQLVVNYTLHEPIFIVFYV